MYGVLKEGVLYCAPINYELPNGEIIVDFNQSEELMKQHGFKNIRDNKPIYDSETHCIEVEDYIEGENEITINYIINNILSVPTYEERLASIEDVLLNLL